MFDGWALSNHGALLSHLQLEMKQEHCSFSSAFFFFVLNKLLNFLGLQVVKYFLDTKTFQKVKFVYPKNEESIELMRQNFDIEILPAEFGGKDNSQYDHEEFSNLMAQDDVKAARFWGLDKKLTCTSNGHLAPEPALVTTQSN